jgi:hypothetical protein
LKRKKKILRLSRLLPAPPREIAENKRDQMRRSKKKNQTRNPGKEKRKDIPLSRSCNFSLWFAAPEKETHY